MNFRLVSSYSPRGDQIKAIDSLLKGFQQKEQYQVLLGITGSGKTFTMANVIEKLNRPVLVVSHNKTLAAQLYGEFKQFFPHNAVEYFISYYDYYQPEAYLPTLNKYIEKDLSINQEIEKLRLSTTSSLISGRKDIIVVASVSCIYGMSNPEEFAKNSVSLKIGQNIGRNTLLYSLVNSMYHRVREGLVRGAFRVKGDTIDIYPAYTDFAYRIHMWGDEIEELEKIDPITAKKIGKEENIILFPANLFVTSKESLKKGVEEIQKELEMQLSVFQREDKMDEYQRIKERTELDIEMIREMGYCSGIENYSRHFEERGKGERAFCLLDYFPNDFITMVDESHVTIPQFKGMWAGDRSRKTTLIEYGFRLPCALDNRPLQFQEFESMLEQTVFVSATPAEYELTKTMGIITEQIIRPTGLLDPEITVHSTINQIDHLLIEMQKVIQRKERVLITTLTKRMAEELTDYLQNIHIKSRYIHSEVTSIDRVQILRDLRIGDFDVLVGVNLLREGLDLPEVSLVTIFDADKEGFLRNKTSLIQTIGRAARNKNGKVIMYADKMTDSMKTAIEITHKRRKLQEAFNKENNIIPQTISKDIQEIISQTKVADATKPLTDEKETSKKIEISKNTIEEIDISIKKIELEMNKAAKELNFINAAYFRDQLFELKKIKALKKEKKNN